MKPMERIEAAREARLWLKQIITPVTIVTAVVLSKPENRQKLKAGLDKGKDKITHIFNKDK